MMNIQNAVRQMRIARKLGKISLDQQTRIMRKLQPESPRSQSAKNWERLMALRASIEKDIAPILLAKREAERDCFDIKFELA